MQGQIIVLARRRTRGAAKDNNLRPGAFTLVELLVVIGIRDNSYTAGDGGITDDTVLPVDSHDSVLLPTD